LGLSKDMESKNMDDPVKNLGWFDDPTWSNKKLNCNMFSIYLFLTKRYLFIYNNTNKKN